MAAGVVVGEGFGDSRRKAHRLKSVPLAAFVACVEWMRLRTGKNACATGGLEAICIGG